MLFHGVGFPQKLTAITENQFPVTTIAEIGEKVPYTSPNEVMVIGTLTDGGLFSVQLEGGQKHRTGLQIDITGTEGVLRITNARGFENKDDNAIAIMRNGVETFEPLTVMRFYPFLILMPVHRMWPISTRPMPGTKLAAPVKQLRLKMRCASIV